METLWFKDGNLLFYEDKLSLADECCCEGIPGGGIYEVEVNRQWFWFLNTLPSPPNADYVRFWIPQSAWDASLHPPIGSTGNYLIIPAKKDCSEYWWLAKKVATGFTSAWYWNGTNYTEKSTGLPSLDILGSSYYRRSGLYDRTDNQGAGIIFGKKLALGLGIGVSDMREYYWDGSQWQLGYQVNNPTPLTQIMSILDTTKYYKLHLWATTIYHSNTVAQEPSADYNKLIWNNGFIHGPNLTHLALGPFVQYPVGSYNWIHDNRWSTVTCEIANDILYVATGYGYQNTSNGNWYAGVGLCQYTGSSWAVIGQDEWLVASFIRAGAIDLAINDTGEFAIICIDTLGNNFLYYNSFATKYTPPSAWFPSLYPGVIITKNFVQAAQYIFVKSTLTFRFPIWVSPNARDANVLGDGTDPSVKSISAPKSISSHPKMALWDRAWDKALKSKKS